MTVTEKQFHQQVTDLAKLAGWRTYHTHNSRRAAPGFPDLVLVRDRVIFAELKTQTGRLSDEQTAWIRALILAGQDAQLWRPDDWDHIEETLARRVPAMARGP